MQAAKDTPRHEHFESLAARLAGRRALVTGLTGQDGYYLSRMLTARGARVVGAFANTDEEDARARAIAQEIEGLELAAFDLADPRSVERVVDEAQPDLVYHLAAQSSVGQSWKDPVATARVNAMGTSFLLDALRRHAPGSAFVLAGSCDCYDHVAAGSGGVSHETPFRVTNPYAASKVMAHQMTRCYREEFGLRASVAILFNHTSPRRAPMFVERGIVHAAVRVAAGLEEAVVLGSLETRRDWCWAEDLVEGFAVLGALEGADELVLASGRTHTTADWARAAFEQLGLDFERHIRIDPSRLHAGDRPHTHGNIERAAARLGWMPRTSFEEMVRRLIEHDRAEIAADRSVTARR